MLSVREHLRHDTRRLLEQGGWRTVLDAPQRLVYEDTLSGATLEFVLFSDGAGRVTATNGEAKARALDLAPRLVTPNVVRYLL